MTRSVLEKMSVQELVDRFIALALAQDNALLSNEVAKFNKLFKEMNALEEELKSRPGDQRHRLLDLYEHPNAQVRLKAAKRTLAIAPVAARQMLETIANSQEFPQAGEAGMSLINLDRGIFRPK
jgi:hypothetical protein